MTVFRFKRGIRVGYVRQGYIYFCSLLYKTLPKGKKKIIDDLCRECGGEYWEALREFVTTENVNAEAIALKYFISESTLYRAVRKYYESFPRTL